MKIIKFTTKYLKMIKFSHTIFALPFAGIALIEIIYKYYLKTKILNWNITELTTKILEIFVCMISLRSAAMGFNRLVDAEFDAKNPRTASREIPTKQISKRSVKIFILLFIIIFVISAFMINPLAGYLSPFVIFITFGYSYTKRFTFSSHYVLGFAIGLAPSAVWIALMNRVEFESLLFSSVLMFYIAGFDILYACMDIEFDKKENLNSIPQRFGLKKALWISRITHLISYLFLILIFFEENLNLIFLATILIVGILLFYEHYLVRGGRIENIPIAFFNVNSIISTILFFGLLLDRLIFY